MHNKRAFVKNEKVQDDAYNPKWPLKIISFRHKLQICKFFYNICNKKFRNTKLNTCIDLISLSNK